jgi:hypothetical protein
VLQRTVKGRALLRDIDDYIAGINARLRFDKSTQKPFTRVDIYAVHALIGQIFGEGGGDESRRSTLLDALRKRPGAARGRQVWSDLTLRDDPEHPATLDGRFP